MNAKRRCRWYSLLVAVAGLATGSAGAAVSCHTINAKGVGQDLGDGITQAKIIGGGLLHGTTAGAFTITGFDPPVASFAGTVTFATRHGDAVASVTGVLDTDTGEFSSSGPITGGTGKLDGASGNIALHGTEDLATGAFVEDVTGLLCVDLSP